MSVRLPGVASSNTWIWAAEGTSIRKIINHDFIPVLDRPKGRTPRSAMQCLLVLRRPGCTRLVPALKAAAPADIDEAPEVEGLPVAETAAERKAENLVEVPKRCR
jgi:hypothetical protein